MRHGTRGISLIEALVALAVLGFGMLAVVGLQARLRLAADTSKQRAEAVRIAQETIEERRAFSALATTAGTIAYEDMAAGTTSAPVAGFTSNAAFTLAETVADSPDPRLKTLVVDVSWADRTGTTQAVRLSTTVTGIAPALAASLGVPASDGTATLPRRRHRDIPPTAVDEGVTSRFSPPGGGSVSWVFDNTTGAIVSFCTAPDACSTANAFLLSGFVRFATTSLAPQPADAEVPPSSAFPVEVSVQQTLPASGTITCFEQVEPTAGYVAYWCAVPVTDATPRWSGRSLLDGFDIATSATSADPARYRVCRYTPVTGDVPPRGNIDHPLDYVDVSGPLANQNFLVIRAGNGVDAFACPGDDAATPLVNGNTWRHQPLS